MKTKSYFADSVEAAIRQAHEELGADAMLVESRTASADMRRLGRFEVVVGVPDSGPEISRLRNAAPAVSPREELSTELKMLRNQISDLRKMLQPTPVAPELNEVQQEMVASDLDPAIAETLIQEAEVIWQDRVPTISGSAARKESLRQIVKECIRARIRVQPELNRGNVT